MPASQVGTFSSGGNNTATSFATSFPQTPTLDNMLLLSFGYNRGSATPPTIGGLSGWTLLGEGGTANGSTYGYAALYGRVATSSQTAPTITASASTTLSWSIDEWAGLVPTLPTDAPIAFTTNTTAGAQTMNFGRTSLSAGEFEFAVMGGRGSTNNMSHSVGGGLTDNLATNTRVGYLFTATGTIATNGGSMTGTHSITNNQGTPSNVFGIVGFEVIDGGGGGPTALSTMYKDRTGSVVSASAYYKDRSGSVSLLTPKYKDNTGTVV